MEAARPDTEEDGAVNATLVRSLHGLPKRLRITKTSTSTRRRTGRCTARPWQGSIRDEHHDGGRRTSSRASRARSVSRQIAAVVESPRRPPRHRRDAGSMAWLARSNADEHSRPRASQKGPLMVVFDPTRQDFHTPLAG